MKRVSELSQAMLKIGKHKIIGCISHVFIHFLSRLMMTSLLNHVVDLVCMSCDIKLSQATTVAQHSLCLKKDVCRLFPLQSFLSAVLLVFTHDFSGFDREVLLKGAIQTAMRFKFFRNIKTCQQIHYFIQFGRKLEAIK